MSEKTTVVRRSAVQGYRVFNVLEGLPLVNFSKKIRFGRFLGLGTPRSRRVFQSPFKTNGSPTYALRFTVLGIGKIVFVVVACFAYEALFLCINIHLVIF